MGSVQRKDFCDPADGALSDDSVAAGLCQSRTIDPDCQSHASGSPPSSPPPPNIHRHSPPPPLVGCETGSHLIPLSAPAPRRLPPSSTPGALSDPRHVDTPLAACPRLALGGCGVVVVRPLAACQGEPGSILGGVALVAFACRSRAGRCRWSAGILWILLFSLPFHFSAASYSPRFTCIGSDDLNRTMIPFCGQRIDISNIRNHTGRCRWSAGFLGDLPLPPPFHSNATPFLPHFDLIGFQDLDVMSHLNLFTDSLIHSNVPEVAWLSPRVAQINTDTSECGRPTKGDAYHPTKLSMAGEGRDSSAGVAKYGRGGARLERRRRCGEGKN
ncbi:hypothetical protein PR048_029210 [Dryococelus australis]|uniref:Uncharacterized protein n=1 Tax=Dryococelus australis TaxID=614101 RepID=A0ABQ9GFY3_9NEOP|nr:hypothetical protein PR048_029210 [Dryococelus australis]